MSFVMHQKHDLNDYQVVHKEDYDFEKFNFIICQNTIFSLVQFSDYNGTQELL